MSTRGSILAKAQVLSVAFAGVWIVESQMISQSRTFMEFIDTSLQPGEGEGDIKRLSDVFAVLHLLL